MNLYATEEIKQMIQNEIQSISNLEERITFKELMEGVFLALYETNAQMYQELENRVMEELAYDVNRYLIKTGIVERQYLDRSHHLMSPMEETDLEETTYHMPDIIDSISETGSFRLMTVMLQCDYRQMQELWSSNQQFQGTLETDQTWAVTVHLRPNTRYLKRVAHLYQLFVRNGVPWQTVNAPYLYKMADVMITDLPDGIGRDAAIKNFRIDFGAYTPYIRYNLIPIWNVGRITLSTVGFPVPCEDHKNHEHTLSIKDYGEGHAYLVDEDTAIQNISQKGSKVIITSRQADSKKWNIHVIKSGESKKIDRYTYPIMQNLRAEDFMERFQRKCSHNIKTRAGLYHFIQGFGLTEYLEYQNCKVADRFDGIKETYNMNAFIEDEIRDHKAAKKLILFFQPGKKELWLVRDIASFLVSEVQRIYPEYECGGVIL